MLKRRDIPNPGNNPYFSKSFYIKIENAIAKYPQIEKISSKQLYKDLLETVIAEPDDSGNYQLKKCRTELLSPLNDWERSWSNARLKGLSSEVLSFLFCMLHRTLATRERLHKTNQENSAICNQCDKGEIDDYRHALSSCTKSEPVFNWMTAGLRVYCGDITPDKILHLNLVPDNPLPHDCLPLVWFVGNTLHHLWKLRSAGKQTHLYLIRAELEAQISIVKKSKYADIGIIVETMMSA